MGPGAAEGSAHLGSGTIARAGPTTAASRRPVSPPPFRSASRRRHSGVEPRLSEVAARPEEGTEPSRPLGRVSGGAAATPPPLSAHAPGRRPHEGNRLCRDGCRALGQPGDPRCEVATTEAGSLEPLDWPGSGSGNRHRNRLRWSPRIAAAVAARAGRRAHEPARHARSPRRAAMNRPRPRKRRRSLAAVAAIAGSHGKNGHPAPGIRFALLVSVARQTAGLVEPHAVGSSAPGLSSPSCAVPWRCPPPSTDRRGAGNAARAAAPAGSCRVPPRPGPSVAVAGLQCGKPETSRHAVRAARSFLRPRRSAKGEPVLSGVALPKRAPPCRLATAPRQADRRHGSKAGRLQQSVT